MFVVVHVLFYRVWPGGEKRRGGESIIIKDERMKVRTVQRGDLANELRYLFSYFLSELIMQEICKAITFAAVTIAWRVRVRSWTFIFLFVFVAK